MSIVLGFVDTLKSGYERVKIAINPVTIGTGLKIKTIESLSYNTPIVTNEKGAIGLDSFREKGMIVTKSEDEFASKINDLLTDKSFFTSTNSNLSKAIKDYISLNSKQLDIVINGK
jgi:hypothetical protein